MRNRFLIDNANPDAGIGHSMGILNRAIKIATRNHLDFAYSEAQLAKSYRESFRWKLKQYFRKLRGKKANETHNIGNDLNQLFDPSAVLYSREELEIKIRQGKLKVIELPEFEIPIPSNQQNDDVIYQLVDQFIQFYQEDNIVFKVNSKRLMDYGDYEYASTRNWFIHSYFQSRKVLPIPLSFNSNKINIAIHIRRGDLLPGRQYSDLSSRMLPDAWYLDILNTVVKSITKPIAIHIYSEGKNGIYQSEKGMPFSWKEYFANTPYDVKEYIDSDFKSTFHDLLNADILIGSKSGLSHLTAMLGDQIKLMPYMWHSYKGTKKVIELSNSGQELDHQAIADHIKSNLLLVDEETSPKCD
jgi:hypothetical protein